MLNIFPIQFLAPLAYFLLRVCVGFIMIRLGIRHARNHTDIAQNFSFPFFPFPRFSIICMSIVELCMGTLFILGLYTQIAALITVLLSFKIIMFSRYFTHPLIPSRMFYTLLFFASLSLFITGAGVFAFDLPI